MALPPVACALLVACGIDAGSDSSAVRVPRTFPELRVSDLDGAPHALRAEGGRATLVHFWATWCAPCRQEMPVIDCLHRRAHERLAVVSVSVDADPRLAQEYVVDRRVGFPVLSDPGALQSRPALAVQALPTTLVVAADGTIVERIQGALDWTDAQRLASSHAPPPPAVAGTPGRPEGARAAPVISAASCSPERSS